MDPAHLEWPKPSPNAIHPIPRNTRVNAGIPVRNCAANRDGIDAPSIEISIKTGKTAMLAHDRGID